MILVDPRFGSKRPGQRSSHQQVAEALTELGADVQLQRLECGDFAFLGNGPDGPIWIGTELKVVSDFVNSMRSGRLADQVIEMAHKYQRSYLIVEGFYRARRGSGLLEVPRGRRWKPLMAGPRPVFWVEVERFMASLEEAGVRVRRTRTSHETARVLAHVLYGFWDKPYDEHRSLRVMQVPAGFSLTKEDETTARIRRVAACLPGIGWGRSRLVAERFRSIEGMVGADEAAWEAIDGIGQKIAGDVVQAIREQIPTAPHSSTRRLSTRGRLPARSRSHSRQRPHAELDAGRAAERCLSARAVGDRKPRRRAAE